MNSSSRLDSCLAGLYQPFLMAVMSIAALLVSWFGAWIGLMLFTSNGWFGCGPTLEMPIAGTACFMGLIVMILAVIAQWLSKSAAEALRLTLFGILPYELVTAEFFTDTSPWWVNILAITGVVTVTWGTLVFADWLAQRPIRWWDEKG